jgi:hypothetical protein
MLTDSKLFKKFAERQFSTHGLDITLLHDDHNITDEQISHALKTFILSAPDGFFIKTVKLPHHLGKVPSGLHGPSVGDLPIKEEEAIYGSRGGRQNLSRLVNRPFRDSDLLTVIGTKEGKKITLFTAHGGPIAPRELATLPPDASDEEKEESKSFWAQHALSKVDSDVFPPKESSSNLYKLFSFAQKIEGKLSIHNLQDILDKIYSLCMEIQDNLREYAEEEQIEDHYYHKEQIRIKDIRVRIDNLKTNLSHFIKDNYKISKIIDFLSYLSEQANLSYNSLNSLFQDEAPPNFLLDIKHLSHLLNSAKDIAGDLI